MHTATGPCRSAATWLLVVLVALGLAACGGGGDGSDAVTQPPAPAPQPEPEPAAPELTTLHSGLQNPWSLALLPDGQMLVTQKAGSLLRLSADGRTTLAQISGVPAVAAAGQGGLLDVAVAPMDATGARWIYLSYAEPGLGTEAGTSGTAVLRARLDGDALTQASVIFRQAPKTATSIHYGARLVLGRDDTLFVTLGERGLGSPAQDVAQTLGKVVRIRRDGSAPAGNPDFGAGTPPGLWSSGHRNPQGAALHPDTGELWVSEHGPQGGDEINIARAGANYGWPVRSHGCEYGAAAGEACRIGGGVHAPDYVEPLTFWVPTSIAPSGLAFYTGDMFPEWRGQLFSGALAGQALWRLTLSGNAVTAREAMFGTLGERFRDVRQAPDGALLLLTDSGKLMRLAR